MLNLADLYIPGGLVEYGSGAQEENLLPFQKEFGAI
jgi:hypothetical protein